LLADRTLPKRFSTALAGMGRVLASGWDNFLGLNDRLLKKAAAAGLKSLFIGFETLNEKT